MKYENNKTFNGAYGIELGDEMLEEVVGGGPRIHLHGPKRSPLKTITDVYHTVRKVVKAISDNVLSPHKGPGGNPNIRPADPFMPEEPTTT